MSMRFLVEDAGVLTDRSLAWLFPRGLWGALYSPLVAGRGRGFYGCPRGQLSPLGPV